MDHLHGRKMNLLQDQDDLLETEQEREAMVIV